MKAAVVKVKVVKAVTMVDVGQVPVVQADMGQVPVVQANMSQQWLLRLSLKR